MKRTEGPTDSSGSQSFQELGFFGNIKKDKWASFLVAVQHNIANSRKEPGNLSFSLYQPENGLLQPIWFERFKTKAAHNAHKEQQYFKDAIRVIGQSLEGEPHAITLKELNEIPVTFSKPAEDPQKNRYIITLFAVKPENRQQFINALITTTRESKQSSGNLECNLYEYAEDRNSFVLIERWNNAAAREANEKKEMITQAKTAIETTLIKPSINTRWSAIDISQ